MMKWQKRSAMTERLETSVDSVGSRDAYMKSAPGARSRFEAGAAGDIPGLELPRIQVISAEINLINGLVARLHNVSPFLEGVGVALLGGHNRIRSCCADTKSPARRLIVRVAGAASDAYGVQGAPY